ncbi:hypothetical protein BDV93DRAFT_590292, partial [Ceratobasidium sp. AG-I]
MANQLGKIVLALGEDEFSLREILAYCSNFLDPLSPGAVLGQDVISVPGVIGEEGIRIVFGPIFGVSDQDGFRFQRLTCLLNTIYAHGHRFTGVIFAKASGPPAALPPGPQRNLSLDLPATSILKAICGEEYFPQISILTTGWTRPPTLYQLTHEARSVVHPDRLLPLISAGATISRLQNSIHSTPQDVNAFMRTLELLLDNPPRALAFQTEIAQNTKLKIHETTAGRIIHRRLHEEHQRVEAQLRALIPSPPPLSTHPDPCMATSLELETRIQAANDIIADRNLEVTSLQEDLTTQSTRHAAVVLELDSEIERLRSALNEAEIAAEAKMEVHTAAVMAMREEAFAEQAKAKQRQSTLEVQLRDIQSENSRIKSTQVAATKLAEKELTEAKDEAKAARLEKEKIQGDFDGLKKKV